jgi:hypothetical protein
MFALLKNLPDNLLLEQTHREGLYSDSAWRVDMADENGAFE